MSNPDCASLSELLFTLRKSRSPRHSETRRWIVVEHAFNFTMLILVVFSILAIAIGRMIVSAIDKRKDVLSGRYIRDESPCIRTHRRDRAAMQPPSKL
jgi:hypothetical protein